MAITVKATDEKFTPFYLSGKWWTFITFATSRGFIVEKKSEYTQLTFSQWQYLPLDNYLDAATDGYTIENYPIYLSLDADLYETEVPVGIPDREFGSLDSEDVTIKKWSEWGSSDHIDLSDGTKGIPLVYSHTYLNNVQAANLNGVTGYTLLNQDQYKEKIPVVNDGI